MIILLDFNKNKKTFIFIKSKNFRTNNNIDRILLGKLLNDKKIKFESIKLVNKYYI